MDPAAGVAGRTGRFWRAEGTGRGGWGGGGEAKPLVGQTTLNLELHPIIYLKTETFDEKISGGSGWFPLLQVQIASLSVK